MSTRVDCGPFYQFEEARKSSSESKTCLSLSLYKSIFLIVARSKLFATTLFDESKAKRGAMGCSGDSSSFLIYQDDDEKIIVW